MQQEDFDRFVDSRVKSPGEICDTATPHVCNLMHMAAGISGEAGELLDAIKKVFAYGQHPDMANIVEELGDIEFYMSGMRQALQLRREDILDATRRKLTARYPDGYSDADAAARKDKVQA